VSAQDNLPGMTEPSVQRLEYLFHEGYCAALRNEDFAKRPDTIVNIPELSAWQRGWITVFEKRVAFAREEMRRQMA